MIPLEPEPLIPKSFTLTNDLCVVNLSEVWRPDRKPVRTYAKRWWIGANPSYPVSFASSGDPKD